MFRRLVSSGFTTGLAGLLAALCLYSFAATAQTTPYEIIELKLPDEPEAPLLIRFLNNAGQVAGFENKPGGRGFIARWEPGKTNLTDVQILEEGVGMLALYDHGEWLGAQVSLLPLNPPQTHPLTRRSYGQKAVTRVMHYRGGTFQTVKEFETWGGAFPGHVTAFSETGDGKFVFSEYGGDDLWTRYPPDETGFSYNPHVPHHPEVWKLSDLSGREVLLPTGREVLNQSGDYRYQTIFSHMDTSGNLYASGIFRAHPLTSFGRPIVGTRQEVWVGGFPQSLSAYAGAAAGAIGISQVNRDGEITGLFGAPGSRNVALYLPRPNYGRNAGAHTITTSDDALAVSRVNRQGTMVWAKDGSTPGVFKLEGMLWSGGTNRSLNSLLPPGSVPHPLTGQRLGAGSSSSAFLNDRGWIVTSSRNPDLGAPPDIRHWLMRPVMEAEAFLSTNRVSVGDTFTFTLRVRNHTSTPRTLGLPIGFRFTGTARFQLVGASTPPGPRVVPAFGSFDVQQQIMATNAGTSTWYSQGRLFSGGISNDTALAYTESLQVLDRADLLIKRADEPVNAYGVNDEYQSQPGGAQLRTNRVAVGEISEFHLVVENDDSRARTFRLKAAEGTNPGWEVLHFFNGQDVSAAVRDANGFVLPQLAAGGTHEFLLSVLPTNAAAGDVKRVTYALEEATDAGETRDTVAAVTEFAAALIVNSAEDLPDLDPGDGICDTGRLLPDGSPECTLRAAIEEANETLGLQFIRFAVTDAEGAVLPSASIFPETPLPVIRSQVIIDGFSQNTTATSPPVELNGFSLARPTPAPPVDLPTMNGFTIEADNCAVLGLAISQFPNYGIELRGHLNHVARCFLGTDLAGLNSRANGVLSDDWEYFTSGGGILVHGMENLIGGPGLGNLISGVLHGWETVQTFGGAELTDEGGWFVSGPGIRLLPGADGTKVQGNLIGTSRLGERLEPIGRMLVGILAESDRNDIGGPTGPADLANIIGNCLVGIQLDGADNDVARNQLGIGPAGENIGNLVGIHLGGTGNQVGLDLGNLLAFNRRGIRAVDAESFRIENNRVGPVPGIVAAEVARHQDVGLEIEGRGDGAVIAGNEIAHHRFEGIRVGGDGRPVNDLNIQGNVIHDNGRAGAPESRLGGIHIVTGTGNALTQNLIVENQGRSISLIGLGNDDGSAGDVNDPGDADNGPNDLLNFPVLQHATLAGAELVVGGTHGTVPGLLEMRLEFFTSQDGWGTAETFLDDFVVNTDAAGQSVWEVSLSAQGVTAGQYVTATATDPWGNTSQFATPVLVQGESDLEADGISDAVEANVPGDEPAGTGQAQLNDRIRLASDAGDGNHDGIPDAQQANVVSFPSLSGDWLTLAVPAGLTFREIAPTGPPAPDAPPGHTFPFGFVRLTLSNLTVSATVTLTNFLDGEVDLTTVFAYGPTAGQPQPQWHELSSMRVGNQWQLTFTDGAPGDHDLAANGRITTTFGFARLVPPGPLLTLLSHATGTVTKVSLAEVNGQSRLVTNQVPAVTSVLAWPADASNWLLHYTDLLTPGRVWHPSLEQPATINGVNVVTNGALGGRRFFRLQRY